MCSAESDELVFNYNASPFIVLNSICLNASSTYHAMTAQPFTVVAQKYEINLAISYIRATPPSPAPIDIKYFKFFNIML